MRYSESLQQPVPSVPECYDEIERDFQRILYVEARLKAISSLPFDRLKLKERLLSSLEPPEIEKCFVERNIQLTRELLAAKQTVSYLSALQSEGNVVSPTTNCDEDPLVNIDTCEKYELPISPSYTQWRSCLFVLVVLGIISISMMLFQANLRSKAELVAPPMDRQPLKGGHPYVVNSTPSGEH